MPNDCLTLPFAQGAGGTRTLDRWESCWMPLGEGEERGFPAGRGGGWERAAVPGQRSAHEGQSSLWYRCSFPRPDHSGRVLVRFGGAFLATNVWLNGRLLGSHYGYFGPFGFDITSHLAADNLLVVCCEAPIETDLARKRHVMGYFNDSDSRPYPPSAYFSLPEPYRWEVPIGLWRPVALEYAGPVILDWLRVRPRMEAGDVGVVDVEARLRNLDGRDMAGTLRLGVAPAGGSPLRLVREFSVPGGLEQSAAFTVTIPGARRWLPWRLGEPTLHQLTAEVEVRERPSVRHGEQFGFRDVEVRRRPGGLEVRAAGRPFFLRGANYQPDIRLDQLTRERFEADLALAREAGLDALRVRAHVLPEEFYRAADVAGMAVVADFPLTGAYAYHATGEETRFFEQSVREQVPELVNLLANRPSICAWIGHDSPPWVAANAHLGDVHSVRQNYSIDQEVQGLLERLDPTRPALTAAGEEAVVVRQGWSQGGWPALAESGGDLVAEYGAQALPALDSPVWERLGRQLPADDADPAWLYAGLQPYEWATAGAGLPSEHPDLAALVAAAGAYQAWLIRYATDRFRRLKFAPCQGAFLHQLVDPFPGIGFGVLDFARRPKAGFEAVKEAFNPVRLVLEPLDFEVGSICPRYRPGSAAAVRLHVVNDDPDLAGRARVRWSFQREDGERRGRLREALGRRAYSGAVDLVLPDAGDPAVQVERLSLPVDAEGWFRLSAELTLGGMVLDAPQLLMEVRASAPPARPRRPMPAYLAERLVDAGSLRTDPRGCRFELINRARPATLSAISTVALDGDDVGPGQLLVDMSGRTVPLPARLELPLDRAVPVLVELSAPLGPGHHRLTFELRVDGVAAGEVAVEGEVRPEELRPAPGEGRR